MAKGVKRELKGPEDKIDLRKSGKKKLTNPAYYTLKEQLDIYEKEKRS